MSASPSPSASDGIYVAIDDNQQGPFQDEEVRQMLATGRIRPKSLGWQEGMGDWAPLNTWYAPAQTVVAQTPFESPAIAGAAPERKGNVVFYLGLGGIAAWFVFLVFIGVVTSTGHETERANLFFGLLAFALLGANLVGVILGLMEIFRSAGSRDVRTIIGLALSALQILAIVALIVIGNSHPSTHP